MKYEYKQFYERKLPHRHSPGSTLFLTYRLFGAVPQVLIQAWKAAFQLLELECSRVTDSVLVQQMERSFHRHWFGEFERALHLEKGPLWLKDPRVAKVIADSLHYHNGLSYILHAYCIMANHVHALFTPFLNERSLVEIHRDGRVRFESSDRTLGSIMQSLKGFTAREANKLLGRRGQFWDTESYDHEVRDGNEFRRIRRYIVNNPVKAGLVSDWRQWQWTWVEPDSML